MDNKITATEVSLPKGGGAIQGIGETFQAEEFTGTASLSIPIPSSPCRGFEPQLSINYSSGSGNGCFGLGFNLAIPKISRKTSKGLPRYDESDTFLFLSGDDLVPTAGASREVITNNIQYTVLVYRPRTESAYASIEQWLAADGSSHWQVVSRDNVTSLFGLTVNERISDPQQPTHIFEWLLSESYDAKGNRLVYEYKSEDTDNLPETLCEINRSQTANKYLERIKYGNTLPFRPGLALATQADQWHFEVVFDYGEYNIDTDNLTPYTPAQSWLNRQDAFSTYQAGFEIRSHRLCRNVLMFHRFEEEWGSEPLLVNATQFTYEETPVLSRLTTTESVGYSYENGHYQSKSLPPLKFDYTIFSPEQHTFEPLLGEAGRSLPGLDLPPHYSLIDLYGEGIPGILYSDGITTLYWEPEIYEEANDKANYNSHAAAVCYLPPQAPRTFPIERNVSGATQRLMDVTGNGQLNLLTTNGTTSGYYEANADRSWKPYQTFPDFPTDFNHPDNQLLDVSGDGLADILRMDDNHIWAFPGKGAQGFGKALSRHRDKDIPLPRKGSAEELWQYADILGSGLQHLVRISNGKVECWPSLGYGKFGKLVQLDNAPRFAANLDASRVFLADLDGSGTTDLIYVHSERVDIYLNQSGNRFSEAISINLPGKWEQINQIRFADIYGNGTTCLVFSELHSANQTQPNHWCYDFCQRQKPYLLNHIDNNMGATSLISYCSSTKFYLQDKKKGLPWIVNLPFPVQVVERTEVNDLISGSKLISSFAYHHGYYDGVEREFRGFGLVERQDAETLEDLLKYAPGQTEEAKDFHVAPILTKTWYHTGAWENKGSLSRQYEKEYFQLDKNAHKFPDSIFEHSLADNTSNEVDAESHRQAHWILKGSVLRQEVYALDNSYLADTPYAVTETNYCVRLIQSHKLENTNNKYGVYTLEPRETLSYQYERNADDPRISHQFVLNVDDYGNVLRTCSVAYGRRKTSEKLYPGDVHPEQLAIKVISEESIFINKREEGLNLLGIPLENKSFEIPNINLTNSQSYFNFDEIYELVEQSLTTTAKLLSWQIHYYCVAQQQNALPFGQVSAEALHHHSEAAEFSNEHIQQTLNSTLNTETLTEMLSKEGGYQLKENYWWNPGLSQLYHNADKFYFPQLTRDPFGQTTRYEYDPYLLLPTKVTDALNNEMTVEKIDYQTLQAQRLRDMNQNISEALCDPLGMVIVSTFYGTENAKATGFKPLQEYRAQPEPTLETLMANPQVYLQGVASYFYYDVFSWKLRQQPLHAVNFIAEDYPENNTDTSRILCQIGYSDGFGRELQSKMKVEDGEAFFVNADGSINSQTSTDRWLTSGRTVYNNKGKPVKEYEPYYHHSYHYVNNEILNQFGVTDRLYYDPLERVIRVETAKGFFSEVGFTPWQQKHFDENDTIIDSRFYNKFIKNYPAEPSEIQINEKDALDKAALFYNTPTTQVLDSLGNAFLVKEQLNKDKVLTTYHEYDIQGRLIKSIDPRLYVSNLTDGTAYYNLKYVYPMSGDSPWLEDSTDGGINQSINNVFGNHLWNRSPRNFDQVIAYDALQRQSSIRTKGLKNDGTIVSNNIVERFTYGENQPNAAELNLRGQLYQLRDQSGVITSSQYNLQGNSLETTRQLTKHYKDYINWDEMLDLAQQPELETKSYTARFAFNAIGQLLNETSPDNTITRNFYNDSGLLEKLAITLANNLADGTQQPIINHIQYNAKGQRVTVDYANGVNTKYEYEESTWRLVKLHSTRHNRDKQGKERNTVLQDIRYSYDPVGNITRLKDNTYQTVFYNNQKVEPLSDYTYDALNRLIKANGRQQPGIGATTYKNNDKAGDFQQSKFIALSDSAALEHYQETYQYDDGGNIIETSHVATNSWARRQEIMPDSNRLKTVSNQNGMTDSLAMSYDRSGNQRQLNGNSTINLTFNCCENLVKASIIARADLPDDSDYYTYDSGEMRTRKVSERLINGGEVIEKELKIYLGNYEIKRLINESKNIKSTILKRQSLRIMDDESCVATMFYWQQDDLQREVEKVGTRMLRFHLDNHLGSVALEVDDDAQVISYEEYFPYGGSAFMAGNNQKEVKLKEYRYSGKERDEATGLYYYGARYYAPWLGRWLSVDPAGTVDGLNLFGFVGGNPLVHIDAEGMKSKNIGKIFSWLTTPKSSANTLSKAASTHVSGRPFTTSSGSVGSVRGAKQTNNYTLKSSGYSDALQNSGFSSDTSEADLPKILPSDFNGKVTNVGASEVHFVPAGTSELISANNLVYCRACAFNVTSKNNGKQLLGTVVMHYEGRNNTDMKNKMNLAFTENGFSLDDVNLTLLRYHEGKDLFVPESDHPNSEGDMDDLTRGFLNSLQNGLGGNISAVEKQSDSDTKKNLGKDNRNIITKIYDWFSVSKNAYFKISNGCVTSVEMTDGFKKQNMSPKAN